MQLLRFDLRTSKYLWQSIFVPLHHFLSIFSASCLSEKHVVKYKKQKRERERKEDLFKYLAIHLI